MTNLKTWIISIVAVAALAYATGRYLQPAKVEIKEVEKIVEVIKRDVHTVIREVVRPDGSKEVVTVIDDKTRETNKKESSKETIITNIKPQWRVQGIADLTHLAAPVYGVGIERRILGPVFAGAFVKANREYGVSVSLEF